MEPELAQKWRFRAAMLRERANATDDGHVRAKLRRLAEAWEAKAAQAETPPTRPPPKELREL